MLGFSSNFVIKYFTSSASNSIEFKLSNKVKRSEKNENKIKKECQKLYFKIGGLEDFPVEILLSIFLNLFFFRLKLKLKFISKNFN